MQLGDEKEIKRIVKEFMSRNKKIKINVRSEFEIQLLIEDLRHEHTLLFHVGEIRYKFYPRHAEAFLYPEYIMPELEYQDNIASLLREVDRIRGLFRTGMSQIQIEQGVHDYLCQHITYAEDDVQSHSVVGPILRGRGVCDGISKAAKMLFQVLGVEAHVIDGMAKNMASFSYEPHAWNLIRINQRWYHLDITFDNTLSKDFVRYDYFNLSEKEILKDHIKDGTILFPDIVCSDENDFYVANGLYFSNEVILKEYLKGRLKKRVSGGIQLRTTGNIKEEAVLTIFERCLRESGGNAFYTESVNSVRNVFMWNVIF